jgi:hypothetical protein
MDLRRFIVEERIAAGDPIELIGGVLSEYIRQRLPFEDVGVKIKLVAGKGEYFFAAIGQGKPGDEHLLTSWLNLHGRRKFLENQGVIPLNGNAYGAEQGGQGDHQ